LPERCRKSVVFAISWCKGIKKGDVKHLPLKFLTEKLFILQP
jgi:hypothetical protein